MSYKVLGINAFSLRQINSSQGQRSRSNGAKTSIFQTVHNFFICRPIASNLHQKACIDISFAQDKVNLKSRSKVRTNDQKESIFLTMYLTTFSFTDRCVSPPFRRCTLQIVHLQTNCAQIAPESAHRHQLGSKQREFEVNVKCQGQMGQNSIFKTVYHTTFSLKD